MLPAWIDAETLRWIILISIVVLIVFMFWVARAIRKSFVRITVMVLISALGFGLWVQQDGLADCAKDCSCSLFGMSVEIPSNRIPDFC